MNGLSEYMFLESIRLENGLFSLLPFHQRRIDSTRKFYFGAKKNLLLTTFLNGLEIPQQGLYKCRVIYGMDFQDAEILPYTFKPINTLRLVIADDLAYSSKFADRQAITKLLDFRAGADDILIIQQKRPTDTSYCNIAFFDGKNWITPRQALLAGVQREYLLQEGIITKKVISVSQLSQFKSFKLFNAMIPWNVAVEIPIVQILM